MSRLIPDAEQATQAEVDQAIPQLDDSEADSE